MTVCRAVDLADECFKGIVNLKQVVDGHFYTSTIIFLPSIQTVGCIDICKAEALVKTCHVGLIDARNGVFPGLYILVTNEVGINLVAGIQLQFVGDHLRYQQLIAAGGIAELWYGA